MNYETYIKRKQAEYGAKFDPSDLDSRFAPFLGSNKRIKVKAYGEVKAGTVGVTTGWKPVFLLMANSRSRGSSFTLGKDCEIVS